MSLWSKIRNTVMAVAAVLNISSNNVCFENEGLGCFNNKAPFNNARGLLPQSPDKMNLKYYLYTPKNRDIRQEVTSDTIRQSYFKYQRKSKFIIHGYRDDCDTSWVTDMKKELLRKGNFNVFCVDWAKGADQVDYNQAVANSRVVGAMLAKFIKTLRAQERIKYADIHLIGHSLGAHIAGYAGKRERTLARITGLDPAGPGFEKSPSKVGLDRTDARFVDVIHTDGEPLTKLGFGLKKAVGHVDFYPNGGVDQPGCKNVAPHIFRLIKGKFKDFVKGIACDHARARYLFTESINSPCSFKAYPCANNSDFKNGKCKTCREKCAKFGYNADLNPPPVGKYYMTTHKKSPFCMS